MNAIAIPGSVIDVWSAWTDGEDATPILRTERMDVMRLHITSGKRVPTHVANGEITIFCVQGRVEIDALATSRILTSGQMLYLLVDEPFSITGYEESSLLITILKPFVGNTIETMG